jgi:hypothetical protein
MADYGIPNFPEFTEQELADATKTKDLMPLFFKWQKYTCQICHFVVSIERDSPALRQVPRLHYAVLIGLLNRCSRLLLSTLKLSDEGYYGETTSIIDRCIFESAVKTMWLCIDGREDRFKRFVADGLKTQLIYKRLVEEHIASEGGKTARIEKRTLESISRYFTEVEMSEQEVTDTPRMPDEASVIRELGFPEMFYLAGQRIGSHHVHGSWPSLIYHYVGLKNGEFYPKDHRSEPHVFQFYFTSRIVLSACISYIRYMIPDSNDHKAIINILQYAQTEIDKLVFENNADEFAQI